jgi:hypothetical protein
MPERTRNNSDSVNAEQPQAQSVQGEQANAKGSKGKGKSSSAGFKGGAVNSTGWNSSMGCENKISISKTKSRLCIETSISSLYFDFH